LARKDCDSFEIRILAESSYARQRNPPKVYLVDTTYLRTCILRQTLRSPSVEVRDAAVQAAELWADSDSLRCLREQRETTPWLADYIKKVVRDLES
jgi:hypothetical protein